MASGSAQALSRSGDRRPALPALFRGRRRRHLLLLVGTGLGQAVAAAVAVLVLKHVFSSLGGGAVTGSVVVLLLVAVAVGAFRMAERVVSEMLSQDYVHEIRGDLVRASLADQAGRSIGVTVARTTNDLTSVRNWVALGIAPLACGIPLVAGSCLVLALLSPPLALAAVVPLAALAGVFAFLSPRVYDRSRRQRRARGRLASQIADTVLAADAIRAGGGEERELRRVGEKSLAVAEVAVSRAWAAGLVRGAAATASGSATAAVIAVGLWRHVTPGTIVAAITVIGLLASPVHDLGRVVEYRQLYRAARRVIGPVLTAGAIAEARNASRPAAPSQASNQGMPGLLVTGLVTHDGTRLQDLEVRPGARIVLDVPDRHHAAMVLDILAGVHPSADVVRLGDVDMGTAAGATRRRLIGYAGQGMRLERGRLDRALRYRVPDTGREEVARALADFGLEPALARLPDRERTELRHGGDPLTIPERARLLLARAMLGPPELLLLDHLDGDLGPEGMDLLRCRLAEFPGIVVLASHSPEHVVRPTHRWAVAGTSGSADQRG